MSCGGGQKTLVLWVPSIPIPAPSTKRLLSQLSPLDRQEVVIAWFDEIRERGKASIEDVYDRLQAAPADPHFGPAVEAHFKALIEKRGIRIGIVDSQPSVRPSRKGALINVWGRLPG